MKGKKDCMQLFSVLGVRMSTQEKCGEREVFVRPHFYSHTRNSCVPTRDLNTYMLIFVNRSIELTIEIFPDNNEN